MDDLPNVILSQRSQAQQGPACVIVAGKAQEQATQIHAGRSQDSAAPGGSDGRGKKRGSRVQVIWFLT